MAQVLAPHEREAVLGDLTESGQAGWRALVDVIGLAVRRQATLWRSWRPWLAAFGLALPGSLLLMGFSLSVSWSWWHFVQRMILAHEPGSGGAFLQPVSQLLVLIVWSWTSGFVVGAVSRPTLWVSIASSCSPCLFCLARFRESSLPGLCLLLFLVPAVWGVLFGLRVNQIERRWAIVLAVGVTLLTAFRNGEMWSLQSMLVWPAWYMVATARRVRAEPPNSARKG